MNVPSAHFNEIQAEARTRALKRAPLTDRLPHFFGAKLSPADLAKALASLRLFVIGAGSVGRIVAAHAARLGVKEIKIADPKRYTGNLITQSITPQEVGKFKARSTGRLAKSISPRTRVLVFDGPAQELPPTEFADTDIVALATDNLTIEHAVSNRCVQFGTSLIQGSVHGETMTVQTRCLTNRDPSGPCLCCQFGPEELSAMAREVIYSCEGRHGHRHSAPAANPPTMSISALCSLSADLLITTLLRNRLGLGEPVADTLLEYNCYTHRATTAPLRRNPACCCPHESYTVLTAKRALAQSTLGELARTAGHTGARSALLFTVDNCLWAEGAACRCPEPKFVNRFIPAGQNTAGHCTRCRKPFRVAPFMTHRDVPAETLGPAFDKPLRALGVANPDTVLVRLHNKPILFRSPQHKGTAK